MAHTSTARRRFGAALGAFGVTAVTAAAALVGMAGTASAHTPDFSAECSAEEGVTTLQVELRAYNARESNTVKVTDGDTVLAQEKFGENFSQEWNDLDATVDHTFVIEVQAWDDPNGDRGWSFTRELGVGACVDQTTPPEEPQPSEPPATTEPSAPVEEPTSSEAAPPVAETTEVEPVALAETGASVALPIGIGAVLLAGGVVLMVVVKRRSRA
ncbi:hypothetical protein [Actinophytocola gossypii]|uniref:LPXTG cell wall anchor domain-containing protein n=1 Tax=Actinophytocola gossypii TaxID=2812003 RepID=A0ABT2JGD9_9PSEU|nr:hypothetical protein [Actinophytocola gossypii]MCT2586942.1 hypothetical protein [Actinophytocola gossypii]